jgi:hypothetical protein
MLRKILTIAFVAVLLFSFGCKKMEKAAPQAAPTAPQAQEDTNAQ